LSEKAVVHNGCTQEISGGENVMAKWIPVLKTGSFTGRGGNKIDVDTARLDRIVQKYDVKQRETPFVIGHPKSESPAYGWVEKFKRVGDVLMAMPKQIVPEMADAIKAGFYKYVSCSVRNDDTIRHIGFLGGEAPAVAGLGPVELSEDDSDERFDVQLSEVDIWTTKNLFRNLFTIIRNFRDHIVEKEGAEVADKIVGNETLSYLERDIDRIELPEPEKSITQLSLGEESDMDEELKRQLEAEKAKTAELSQKLDATTTEVTSLKTELDQKNQAITAHATEQRGVELSEIVGDLVESGKLTVAESKELLPVLTMLHGSQEVDLSEGEGDEAKTVKKSPLEILKNLFQAMPQRVSMQEIAKKSGAPKSGNRHDHVEIARLANEYQLSEQEKGNTVSIAIAVDHVMKSM
jgi:hypothetical protein